MAKLQQQSIFTNMINAKGNVRNLRAKAVVKFAAQGSNVVIKKLDIDYSLGQVQAHLSGSSGIVNSGFNRKLSKLLTTDKGTLITKAKHVIEKAVNKMLRGFTPAKLIETISQI
ncbi:uncharacterized protein [Choristoneura fumiferana]|uniref:uncharacterized protein n=1 Tax=Choristoneura fumiferana TaxID=7141 RepID=UPI003D156702